MSIKTPQRRLFIHQPLTGFFILLLTFTACKKDTDQKPVQPDKYLVSSSFFGQYEKAELVGRVVSIPTAGNLARYPIKVYKLTYKTIGENGAEVTASGALLIPVTDKPLPLLSYQHGTIRKDEEGSAPSYYKSGSEVYSAVSVVASNGFVISAPDYLGYGASKDLPHPYEHAATLASASFDLLLAAKEFCAKENIPLNNKTFLTGYSEGGFATMALHKYIEEKHASELTVTASSLGAGAYDKTAFSKYILDSDQKLEFVNTYAWVLDSYNRIYGINRPYTYYYNAPYSDTLQANIWGTVDQHPKQLFTEAFRSGIVNGTDTQLTDSFKDNDIYDWKPNAPVTLFHGTADTYVPFFNSQHAYDAMKARGANVILHRVEGKDHATSVAEYRLGTFSFFAGFQ